MKTVQGLVAVLLLLGAILAPISHARTLEDEPKDAVFDPDEDILSGVTYDPLTDLPIPDRELEEDFSIWGPAGNAAFKPDGFEGDAVAPTPITEELEEDFSFGGGAGAGFSGGGVSGGINFGGGGGFEAGASNSAAICQYTTMTAFFAIMVQLVLA